MKSTQLRTVPKIASYTVNRSVDRDGTVFTNRGATGSVTFTLPTPNAGLMGSHYSFRGVADQTFIVASATAGTALAINNAAATSLAAQTGGQKIGARIDAFCDGTSWHLFGVTNGVTYTVA